MNWFNRAITEVAQELKTDLCKGLDWQEAKQRLTKYGKNQLQAAAKISPWQIFLSQFLDFMVLVLIGAAIVSGLLGEKADALTIVAIVVLNAFLGFIQEYRAEKSLEALKELTAPQANVIRNSKIQKIAAAEIVPGDLVVLESGDRVPADGRIIEAINLKVNEATLTGESIPVQKEVAPISAANLVLGDQKNMIFAGTSIAQGRGKAIITGTGMRTEIGKIAGMISTTTDEETPLQRRLTELGRWLVLLCLTICAAVGTLGILRGEHPRQMFLSAVSLAVAAIPEGLPAIVTIALAIGVQKMIRRNAIIRKLPAVETLGCATVICSDKTGTLTQNKLSVTKMWTLKEREYSDQDFGKTNNLPNGMKELLQAGILCNNAVLEDEASTKGSMICGDPTEGALLVAAVKLGISPKKLQDTFKRLGEIPFSSERKRMSVWVNDGQNKLKLVVKGAADVILERCSAALSPDGIIPLTPQLRREIRQKVDEWGADALRVLAFALREAKSGEINSSSQKDPEQGLVFLGLMGMTDPPRPESQRAVEKSRRAGIQVKMITGDYPKTAAAIAKQIGLLRPNGKIITGAELDNLSDQQLAKIVKDVDIFARVSPNHKLRVVKALKQKGEIVAMTGDGVNDAPAIKEADIGVAMGLSGTDVTKEASAMVIADDNFATIVAAIEEGRIIYDNIRKFIRYLLSCNMGEILTMFGGILLGMPFPMLPIQILWVNLVTDGLPAIALGLDPAEKGIMARLPRSPQEGIFSRGLGLKIILQGLLIGGATLAVYMIKLGDNNLAMARTAAFTTLVFSQLMFVFRCRSEYRTIFQINIFENHYLNGAVLVSTVMQLLVLYLPWLNRIFYTTPLSVKDWAQILGIIVATTYLNDLIFQFRSVIRKHLSFFKVVENKV